MNNNELAERLQNVELSQVPLFPQAELEDFVAERLERREIYLKLHADGKTPCYVLETAVLLQRAREFRETLARYFINP
ncbi:MAG: hypothetical protein WCP79_14915, partial [Bacillota bacterium]